MGGGSGVSIVNGGDGVGLRESNRLGQDGGRGVSRGGRILSQSDSRQSGDGEHEQLHLCFFGTCLLFYLMLWRLARKVADVLRRRRMAYT